MLVSRQPLPYPPFLCARARSRFLGEKRSGAPFRQAANVSVHLLRMGGRGLCMSLRVQVQVHTYRAWTLSDEWWTSESTLCTSRMMLSPRPRYTNTAKKKRRQATSFILEQSRTKKKGSFPKPTTNQSATARRRTSRIESGIDAIRRACKGRAWLEGPQRTPGTDKAHTQTPTTRKSHRQRCTRGDAVSR